MPTLREVKGAGLAGKCEICGRGPSFGHNVSHSKRRTNRMFRLNIQRATLYQNGQPRKVNICTRCLRTLSKPARVG
ncbi:MAG TPA: 50S ribosomal protein L28 [Thermomicrobiaceae bacterium]|nr:50S ribosomal protein L28 [Thermomicrobiaceae bacterium]